MKITQYVFPGTINLYNLGDVHRGDFACNVKLFRKVIDHIAKDANGYWVSIGDLLNVALKTSKSNVYQSLNLDDEKTLIQKELAPIAKKCLGIVKSNHHNRFDREVGMSLDKLLCELMDVPFLGGLGVLNITCGRTSYYVAMHHGTGAGASRGSKANRLEKLCDIIPGADLYLEGHTHSYQSFFDTVHYIDRKRNLVTESIAHFCTTGHFLNWSESYAVDTKLPPMPQGTSVCELRGNDVGKVHNKKIKVDLIY